LAEHPHHKAIEEYVVRPGTKARLQARPTRWTGDGRFAGASKKELRALADAELERSRAELAERQELLYANDRWALLVIFQAMDAAGKDSTIKHVMSGVNPQGCQVYSFKQPSQEDLDHTFLWRCMKALPERGRIGIFNRSYYEEVLVVKVHDEILASQRLPPGDRGPAFWAARYEDINNFEHHLVRNGTKIVKFFLHVSKDEQRQRFLDRLDEPDKLWKFSPKDLDDRARWDDYQAAYEQAIGATSTEWAPWYVIPADRKWAMRTLVATTLVATIDELDLEWPTVSETDRKAFEVAKAQLLAERS
jgi:PPK2 family polyphosphate:nucleotide phosphotransferase